MGVIVNPGNLPFQSAASMGTYVDKTGLLAYTNSVIASTDAYICNSRPHGFGKTTTSNMLAAYYSKGCDSEAVFSGLEISGTEAFKKHRNKYDVIYLNIHECIKLAGSPEQVVRYISEKTIQELRIYYPVPLSRDTASLPEALSIINAATNARFVVIIDDWDAIVRDHTASQAAQDGYFRFLSGMFKGTEPTKYIALAYLAGIFPIKKGLSQTALNNFDEFSMISSSCFGQYMGFTDNEIERLAHSCHLDCTKAKNWCGGYLLRSHHVYSPLAVTNIIQDSRFENHFLAPATYTAKGPAITSPLAGLKEALVELLSGSMVRVNTAMFNNDPANIQSLDDVLTYMIHLGYLGYDQTKRMVFIPNEMARKALEDVIKHLE